MCHKGQCWILEEEPISRIGREEPLTLRSLHKKLTLLGAGGCRRELHTAGLLGTHAGLWEAQQFKNVPSIVQAETPCKVTWPIRTCLTHFSLKIALFGPFGVEFEKHTSPPKSVVCFLRTQLGT